MLRRFVWLGGKLMFWTNPDGTVVVNGSGHPIDCPESPCAPAPSSCGYIYHAIWDNIGGTWIADPFGGGWTCGPGCSGTWANVGEFGDPSLHWFMWAVCVPTATACTDATPCASLTIPDAPALPPSGSPG